jgi:TP901 family phage tail tape measure protein
MAQTEKRDVIITLQGGQALHTIQDMQVHMRKLRSEFRKTSDESKRSKIAAEMKKVNGEISKQYQLTRASRSGFEKLRGTIMKLGGGIAAMMGFQVLTDQVGNLIRRNAELSDSYADVQKTTGLTNAQVKELDKSFKQLDTRSSRKELLQLARDAGKLGKDSVAEVANFVEQADKINVALGEDLGDKALVTIGKLANIFQTDMLKIGSAINEVGASSEASEPALVEFLSRLGGIATTAKLSAPDIIGYGATLDALGLKAEMSTTALNTFFIDFIKNSEEMGKVAGFAEGELSKLIGEEGTNAGFVAFLEKLRETHPEQKQFLQALEQMGIDGARGSQVFLTLANNTEMLRKQQDIANDSFEKGTSIIDEFNVKNNNFAANLSRIQKQLGRMFMSSGVVQGIESLVNGVADYMKVPLSRKMQQEQVQINVLVGRILELNEGNEDRAKLMEELNASYPQLLEGLDKETASNEDLAKKLEMVNEQLVNRIIIQRKQEELDTQNEKVADARMRQMEAEADLRKQVAEMALEYNVTLQAGMSLEEKVNAVNVAANKEREKSTALRGRLANQATNDMHNLFAANKELSLAEGALKTAQGETNNILKEREELMEQLNIKTQKSADKASKGGQGPATIVGDPKQIKEVADKTKDLIKQLQDVKLEAIDNVEQHAIAAAKLEYERQKAEIEETAANEEVKNDLLEQLYKNFTHKKDVIHAEAAQKRIEHEQQLIEDANNSELLTLELRVDVAEDGSMEQLEALEQLLYKQMEMELQNDTLTYEQKQLIMEDYSNRMDGLWKEYWGERKNEGEDFVAWEDLTQEERIARMNAFMDRAKEVWGQLADAISGIYDAQLQAQEQARNTQLERLDEQLEKGVINQEEYAEKREEIEEKYAAKERKIKRKQFEVEKTANMMRATMSAAQAVLAAMNAPIGIAQVMAGIMAGLAAVQVGIIAAQPNPYYRGGRTGVTDTEGNSYMANNIGTFASGGSYSTPSYGIVAEKGAELVIPNWLYTSQDYSDTMEHLENAIARGYASGGRTTRSGSQKPQFSNSSSSSGQNIVSSTSNSSNKELVETMKSMNTLLQTLVNNGVISKWEFQTFVDGVVQMENIDNRKYLVGQQNRRPGQRF